MVPQEINAALCPWSSWAPASISFCEKRLCQWIVEPANTWSNIGFVLVGIAIVIQARSLRRNDLSLVGLVSCLVGLGSAAFHGTATRWGEIVDVSAMYFISTLFIAFSLKRFLKLPFLKLFLVYFGTLLPSVLYLVISGSHGIYLFAVQITITSLIEIYMFRRMSPRPNYRYLSLVALTFTFSFTMWALDVLHILCDPNNHILGGHAVWHLANAAVLWFYYKFQQQFPAG